jgi:light-regulated signal transduction histidine kinase (bacteriophytochrome)
MDRVLAATARMSDLIDALLELSRIGRVEVARSRFDLSACAAGGLDELRRRDPARIVDVVIEKGLVAYADPRLARALLDNVLGNAWKFTSNTAEARIEVGSREVDGERAFFVRDNGAGFDMAHATKLFTPFTRLHSGEFSGTGIGLATVRRIVHRHGGRAWAEGSVDAGATFHIALPEGREAS